jgi:SAM-dependent methyltransferase
MIGPGARLFLVAATVLFVEVLLIRWIPANVAYVGYFNNFILIASFLGIGLGILLGRRGVRLPVTPFAPVLLAVIVLVSWARFDFQLASTEELFFGLTDRARDGASFFVLPLVVVLTTTVLASVALPMAPLFRAMPPLRAYAFDVLGSLAGIAAAIGLSALGTNIVWWFALVAVAFVAGEMIDRGLGRAAVAAAAMGGILAVIVMTQAQGERWSPYYRVQVYGSPGDWAIAVNGIGPHQRLWPSASLHKEPFYEQVYRWFPGRTFERVLVIGAGSGTDVAVALARGAGHVDAVEIDPVILSTGAERHPDHPYADARVHAYLDDGRAYLQNTDARYDLVVYALPDSLVLATQSAGVRLESFLFTREAFKNVRERLQPGGVFALYNYYREPWLAERLAGMLEEIFGRPPLFRHYPQSCCYAAAFAAQAPPATLPAGDTVDPLPSTGELAEVPRDDWPFPYLRSRSLPYHYLVALGLILLFAVVAVVASARATGLPRSGFSPHFFALGAAFLLLETRSLVTFGLLFGTTWIVNAFVFFAILVSILAAIAINARFRLDPRLWYVGLFATLALGYALPPASLLIDPPEMRYLVASGLAFAPVFFANLVFAYSFRDTRIADMAFASNLLGAMVGGVLEYAALLTGYQVLLLMVAGLYLAAFLLARRWRLLADRALVIS